MKIQSLAIVAITILLASCQCNTSDSSKLASSGSGMERGTNKGDLMPSEDRVYFSFDKYNLTDEGKAALDDQGKWMINNPEKTVQIVGHCDSRGTSEYNLGLGERRANASKEYLVQLGVEASRISVTSVGKEQPVVSGENEEAWSKNRTAITIEQ